MVLVIAVTEAAVMIFFDLVRIDTILSPLVFTLIDAAILSVVASLVIYGWIVRPMKSHEAFKRTEEALRQSENMFRSLSEQSLVGTYIIQDGKFRYVNPQFAEIFGYSVREITGILGPQDLTMPADWPVVLENMRKRHSGEQDGIRYEFMGKRRDGSGVCIEVFGSRIEYGQRPAVVGTLLDVTGRKRSEGLLREQKLFAEKLVQNSAVATFVLDAGHRVVLWNKACEELTGVTAPEITGTVDPWAAFYDHKRPVLANLILNRATREAVQQWYPQCSASALLPQGFHADLWFRNRKGEERFISFDAAPIPDSSGNVIAAVQTMEDLTGKKRLEEQVFQAKQDWENTFNSLTDMVTVHDKDFNIILANKAARKILKLPVFENMKANKCYAHFHGAGAPPKGCPSCGCLQTGKSVLFEVFEPHLSMFMEMRAIPRFDNENHLVGLIHIVRDITDRKHSQDAIETYSKELTALNSASNDLMSITSTKDIYQEVCNRIFSVFDLKMVWLGILQEDETVKAAAHAGFEDGYLDQFTFRRNDPVYSEGPMMKSMTHGMPASTTVDDESFEFWRDEARKRGYESVLAVPLISRRNVCLGALALYSGDRSYFNSDRIKLCQIFANQAATALENAELVEGLESKVRERMKQLEDANRALQILNQELEIRRVEAEAASRAKTDFLSNMSHELRTPLNSVIGFTDVILMGMAGPVTDKQKEFLGDISRSGTHLLTLISEILDLSKVESGKMRLESSEFSVKELVDSTLFMFKEKALKHAITVTTSIEEGIGLLKADRTKLKQVLLNLFSNAFKFSDDGAKITATARYVPFEREGSTEDGIEIAVTDTGVGISEADQKKLFQPFQQVESSLNRKFSGTGLGLSLCRRFVELHGGRIRVQSAAGAGSTFSFIIPQRQREETIAESPPEADQSAPIGRIA